MNANHDYPIGQTTVGYRYGAAPESGYSHNYATGRSECGVAMASVGMTPECRSFATLEARESRRRYYYRGIVAGTGGDDEVCLTNVVRITHREYITERGLDVGQTVATVYAARKAWGHAHNLRLDMDSLLCLGVGDPEAYRRKRYDDTIARIRQNVGEAIADEVVRMVPRP